MTVPAPAPLPLDVRRRATSLRLASLQVILEGIFGKELHNKQVTSLANATGGVLVAASLAIHAIGRGYSLLAHTHAKHGIKQVDRLLGNPKIDAQAESRAWVTFVVGARRQLLVALDWTDFDGDEQSTLSLCLLTRHGRATPLLWKTYDKAALTDGGRTDAERALLVRLDELLPPEAAVTLLADRGFGDQALYQMLQVLGWDFVIRFRGCIHVETHDGQVQPASSLVQGGRARMYKGARVTAQRTEVAAVVMVHAKGMKDPWILATSLANLPPSQVVKLYGRRFCIEETFRDEKDVHFGLGLSATHVGKPERRDRLLLLGALAQVLLTLLGAASERLGWDKRLQSNTSKRRQLSLFHQGQYWFSALGLWPYHKLEPLLSLFDQLLSDHAISLEMLEEI